jgi:hypothetical protein
LFTPDQSKDDQTSETKNEYKDENKNKYNKFRGDKGPIKISNWKTASLPSFYTIIYDDCQIKSNLGDERMLSAFLH